MKVNRIIIFSVICTLVLFISTDTFAQCAMCKATAASDLKNGGTLGKGLNFGILYLMCIPYLILFGLCFLFFRKQMTEKFHLFRSKLFRKTI